MPEAVWTISHAKPVVPVASEEGTGEGHDYIMGNETERDAESGELSTAREPDDAPASAKLLKMVS